MTRSEQDTLKTHASLRIRGDALDPQLVTRILKIVPTIAYAKGETYHAGERTGELVGKTGVWLLSTDGLVASESLHHHLFYILGILVPGRQDAGPLIHLHALLTRQKGLRADMACFWHGRFGAKPPAIPKSITEFLKLVPADLEIDFDTDGSESERRRA